LQISVLVPKSREVPLGVFTVHAVVQMHGIRISVFRYPESSWFSKRPDYCMDLMLLISLSFKL
jgi:hypothetical protein